MMKYSQLRPFQCLLLFFTSLTLCFSTSLAANTVRIDGHIPEKIIAHTVSKNRIDADILIYLTFVLPLRGQDELQELIYQLHDSSHEKYGQYLTSEEFIDRFSPTDEQYNQVISYAESLGLTVQTIHSNRQLLNVSGSAKAIESAFNSGAYDNYANNSSTALVVDDPASQPYVVGVGGTKLVVDNNTGAYISESIR